HAHSYAHARTHAHLSAPMGNLSSKRSGGAGTAPSCAQCYLERGVRHQVGVSVHACPACGRQAPSTCPQRTTIHLGSLRRALTSDPIGRKRATGPGANGKEGSSARCAAGLRNASLCPPAAEADEPSSPVQQPGQAAGRPAPKYPLSCPGTTLSVGG